MKKEQDTAKIEESVKAMALMVNKLRAEASRFADRANALEATAPAVLGFATALTTAVNSKEFALAERLQVAHDAGHKVLQSERVLGENGGLPSAEQVARNVARLRRVASAQAQKASALQAEANGLVKQAQRQRQRELEQARRQPNKAIGLKKMTAVKKGNQAS
ncbi:MAG: hypothetical protein Q8P30_04695 [Candidatus Uhrbacteria bacterium]|nr:hypothetical protein [Candidatus Uhrbacteria bacterium]